MSYSVTIGHTTYQQFPTAKSLQPLSNVLIYSFLDFMRAIGICTMKDTMRALGTRNPMEVELLAKKCRLNPNMKGHSNYSTIRFEYPLWQSKVLKGDESHYTISMTEVLERAISRNKYYQYNAIEHEVELALLRAKRTASL
ncbi:hypothetical protein IKG20_01460 [Candidatus Saccharibacteria bacterium]|nr:hypothetical protein [Candidatus Saccharibacteria bacterium]